IQPSLSFHDQPHHRDLHSFPTRRSSDLANRDGRGESSSSGSSGRRSGARSSERCPSWSASSSAGFLRWNDRRRCARAAGGTRQRSEEHTSELQSQSNLVCRLLLEKKKKT